VNRLELQPKTKGKNKKIKGKNKKIKK